MTGLRRGRVAIALTSSGRVIRAVAANLSRQAFEVFVMALAMTAGATGLWSVTPTKAPIDHLLPGWARWMWYGGLFLGGLIATIGIATSKPDGSAVERSGLLVLLGVSLSYSVLAFSLGPAGTSQGAVVTAFALCLAARVWSITLESQEIRAAIKLIRSTLDGEN